MVRIARRVGSLVVVIAAFAVCATVATGAADAVRPSTTLTPSATCPSVTTNHITKKSIQECQSVTSSVSSVALLDSATTFSATLQTNLVTVGSSLSGNSETLVEPVGSVDRTAVISPTSDQLDGLSSTTSSSAIASAPSSTPILASPVDVPSQIEAEAEADTFLDNVKFLSFEEWKVQNLAKVGQSAEHVGQGKSGGGSSQDRSHPGHLESGLDSLGDEGEIEIPFGGFGGDIKSSSQDGKATHTSTPSNDDGASPAQHTRNKDAGKTSKERFNYASFDCAANVLKTNPRCRSSSAILVENKDRYMLNECRMENKFIIVELCDDIFIDTVVLANFEFFSSMFRMFRISVSDRFPVKADRWKELGTYEARNSRDVQAFLVENPLIWARYLRIEFLTHYGSEFYCPVSLLRVHGTTMMAEFRYQEELARGELDDEEEEEAATVVPVRETAIAPLSTNISVESSATPTPVSKVTEKPANTDALDTLGAASFQIADHTTPSQSILMEPSSSLATPFQDIESSSTASAIEPTDITSRAVVDETNIYVKTALMNKTTARDTEATRNTSLPSAVLLSSQAETPVTSASVSTPSSIKSSTDLSEMSTTSTASVLNHTATVSPSTTSSLSTTTNLAGAQPTINSSVANTTDLSSKHLHTESFSPSSSLILPDVSLDTAPSVTVGSDSSISTSPSSSSSSPSSPPASLSSSSSSSILTPSSTSLSPTDTVVAASATSPVASSTHSSPSSISTPHSAPSPSSPSLRAATSSSSHSNQAHSPPATQESFFKSIHKRLQNLESNSSLSLQYIELQSQLLREAFGKVERRNLAKTSSFLEALNASVTAELARFKADYDSLWQTTVLELTAQREDARKEAAATSDHVRLLADEIISQKRLMAAQATLLLLCLGFVIFARVGSAPGLESGFVPNLAPRGLKTKDIRRRRFGWDSPWSTPIRIEASPRPGVSSEEERDRASEDDDARRSPEAESIDAQDFANQSSISDGEPDSSTAAAVPSIEVNDEGDVDENALSEILAGSQSAPATPGPSTLLSLFDTMNGGTGKVGL